MAPPRRPWYTILYVQVLIAIAAGILIGHYFSNLGVALKPLGDGFISLIKMMIGPVIFCTVVHGIGSMRDLKKVGRVGVFDGANVENIRLFGHFKSVHAQPHALSAM